MKFLKMNFLYSLFGLQLLLALNTVWAADDDPPLTDAEMDEKLFAEFVKPDSWGEPSGNPDPDTVGGADENSKTMKQLQDLMDEVESDIKELDGLKARLGLDDSDENMPDFNEDPNDDGLDNSNNDNHYVDHGIRAKDTFIWPEGKGSCSLEESLLDQGLNEAVTLVQAVLDEVEKLVEFDGYNPTSIEYSKNIVIATAQFWGLSWESKEGGYIAFEDLANVQRAIFPAFRGVYESILEKIMMKRESKKRLRLNCGDENVEEIEGRDGKVYWRFKFAEDSFVFQEKTADSLCSGSSDPRTAVWVDDDGDILLMACGPLWEKYRRVSLDSMIKNQKTDFENDEELQLDDRMSLGGVMIHLFMHAYKLADDVPLLPGKTPPGWNTAESRTVSSYYWCVALATLDATLKKEPEDRESLRNIPSYVLYATNVVISDVSWSDRAKLPMYRRRNISIHPDGSKLGQLRAKWNRGVTADEIRI